VTGKILELTVGDTGEPVAVHRDAIDLISTYPEYARKPGQESVQTGLKLRNGQLLLVAEDYAHVLAIWEAAQ